MHNWISDDLWLQVSKALTLPYYASYLRIPFEILGLITASSTITGIFMNLLSGYLSDIYCREKIVIN